MPDNLCRNSDCDTELQSNVFDINKTVRCGRRATQANTCLQQSETRLDSESVAALVTFTSNIPELPALGRDGQTNATAGDDATCVAPALRGMTA